MNSARKMVGSVLLVLSLFAAGNAGAETTHEVTCYGFEVDAGQLDEVGAAQLKFDMAGTGNALDPRFDAHENVWVCSSDKLGIHPLTHYFTFTDKKGHTFARGY